MSNAQDLINKLQSMSPEQFEQIAGGSCTVDDIMGAIDHLTEAYESLIDFTSHVIERVVGP